MADRFETDSFHLARFVRAQEAMYPQVLTELRNGRKLSHWIWFIFPQMRGLGRSPNAEFYGIRSLDEARAYYTHPLLGPRLEECTILVLAVRGTPIDRILGPPDDMKFRSSMTLFAQAVPENTLFPQALDKYFGGRPDQLTLELLG
ncbi:MAG: DUF1810 domain-containing protein [Acidobacteriota bacterium]|nr:DUF1810 domain-containing protein [Acidobacteriota bacterium]